MLDLLKDHRVWKTIPSSADMESNENDDEDDCLEDSDEDVESVTNPSEELIASIVQEASTDSSFDIEADIETLQAGKVINSDMKAKLSNLQKSLPKFKKADSDSISF